MASSVKLIALNRMWPILQGNSEYWAVNGFVEVEEIDEMRLVSIGYVLATNKKPIGDMTDGELADYVAWVDKQINAAEATIKSIFQCV
jgi:hypothetical protein